MAESRYILEPYKGMATRYRCPSCQQRDKTFSRYIDTETGSQLADNVGRCNRESNCGYHYTPKQYFKDNKISFDIPLPKAYKPSRFIGITPQSKPVTFIPVEVFKASLKAHEANHFVKFLINLFGEDVTAGLISKYFIGSSKHWPGATVFWQIDTQGKIRTGKIMLYNPTTGKRDKTIHPPVYWVHKALNIENYKQCLFGEQLLNIEDNKGKPVAIVESEKTAIIASVYLPQFIWLAFGGIGFKIDKCSVLKGRTVILFPDLSKPEIKPTAFEKWSSKAKELSQLASFQVSDLLERKATEAERKQGFDLADYLIKYDYKAFALSEPEAPGPPPAVQPLVEVKPVEQPEPVYYFAKPEQPKPESWEQDITELENYFAGIALPHQPVKLNPYSMIINCSLFIESHFAPVKANNGKRTFLPYLNRLQELKQVLTTNSN